MSAEMGVCPFGRSFAARREFIGSGPPASERIPDVARFDGHRSESVLGDQRSGPRERRRDDRHPRIRILVDLRRHRSGKGRGDVQQREADRRIFGDEHDITSRHDILQRLIPFVEREQASGTPIGRITRHILGLFQGQPGARAWRRHISENAHRKGADLSVILEAAAKVPG